MKNKNLIGISGKLGAGKDEVAKIIQYLTSKETGPYIAWLNAQKVHGPDPTITYKTVRFAGKLKQIICLLTGCTLEELESQEFKNKELGEEWEKSHWVLAEEKNEFDEGEPSVEVKSRYTYRSLLQRVGTDALRDVIHEDIHVNALFADYRALFCGNIMKPKDEDFIYPNWIITDMRFGNEMDAVKKRGGITIRINRGNGIPSEFITREENAKLNHPSETALDDAEFDHVIDNSFDIDGLVAQVKNILQMEDII